MITASTLYCMHKEVSLVLPEPQYLVCVRMHSVKLEPLIPQGLC